MIPDWAARPATVPYAVFGDPQSLNLYNYVRNDPVSRVDADGHCGPDPHHCSGDGVIAESCDNTAGQCTTKNQTNPVQNNQAQTVGTQSMVQNDGYSYVSAITNVTLARNSKGDLVTTVTTATARFSTAKGEEGKFLGAELTTESWTSSPVGPRSTTSESIGYSGAARIFGADSLAAASANALPQYQFVRAVASDAREHPARYAFYVGEVAATVTPLPEAYAAYEGVKAFVDASVAAWHLAWDLGW